MQGMTPIKVKKEASSLLRHPEMTKTPIDVEKEASSPQSRSRRMLPRDLDLVIAATRDEEDKKEAPPMYLPAQIL